MATQKRTPVAAVVKTPSFTLDIQRERQQVREKVDARFASLRDKILRDGQGATFQSCAGLMQDCLMLDSLTRQLDVIEKSVERFANISTFGLL